jgi:hypothetical protein
LAHVCGNLKVGFPAISSEDKSVKAAAAKSQKREAELLDHANNNLLRALKRDMEEKEGRVDYDKLRKDGYSARILDKLANLPVGNLSN